MKQRILLAILMGSRTTCLVSLTVIALSIGFVTQFVLIWLKAWRVSLIIAVPVRLFVDPGIQHLVNHLYDHGRTEIDHRD